MAEGMDPLSVDEQRKQIADRLFQEEAAQEAQQQEFRQRAWDMTQPPPDQAAEALSLGNKFGVPRQAVEADPELWRRKDENARASLMREVSPRTLAWLDNEDNYAVAKDDKDILAEIESTFSKIGYAIKGGAQRFAAGGVAYERQAIGETMDYYRRLDAWEQREERRKKLGQDAPQGWRTVRTPDIGTISGFDLPIYYGNLDAAPGASGIVREQVRKALPATMRPMFMSQVDRYDAKAVRPILERKMAEVDARGRAVTAEFTESLEKARSDNFILNGLTQAMTSITEMAPSMAAFFVLRGRGGATVGSGAMGAQVFGAEYLEGVYNLNLDERAASDRALLQAGVEVVTERISLGVLDDMRKSDKGFLTKLGVSMAAEQIQEQAATLGNRLVDIPYVAPDTTVQQFLADTPEAAANTAITTLFAAGITNTTLLTIDSVARRMVTDSINASESAGDRAIKTLLDKAQKAKTSKRSPEKMAEFIEGLAEQSNLETVVVDLDGVVQALNQGGINPTETLSALGVSQDELQQRYERFGEIEIKTSTLVTSPAMASHRAAIEPHVKAKQDAATPAQKEALRADFEAALKDGAAQIQDAIDAGKTTAEKVAQVREAVKARILGAGIYPAGPQAEAMTDAMTAMLTTLPQRTGQDVLDFYAAKAPKIQGVMEGEVMAEEDVLPQAQSAGYEGQDRGEAASWLRGVEKFGPEGMTTEARMARRKAWQDEAGTDPEVSETVFYRGQQQPVEGDGFIGTLTPGFEEQGMGVSLTSDPDAAEAYGSNIYPVYLRGKFASESEFVARVNALFESEGLGSRAAAMRVRSEMQAEGYAGLKADGGGALDVGEVRVWMDQDGNDPSNIRSVHAVFDPDQSDSADLLGQLIGPKAKGANKEILNHAKKMARERVKVGKGLLAKTKPKYTRQQIWDETAKMGQPWYQDQNGDWISEIEDGSIVVKDGKGPLSEVIEFPSIYAEYPELKKMRADARDKAAVKRESGKEEPGGVGGWYSKSPFLFGVHVRIISRGNQREYTATHEIQHAVDDIEGRQMGRKKPYYSMDTERRAFNTMYRRLMTMEERIATPPWVTEAEAVNWWAGQRDMGAAPAQFTPPGTPDPGATIEPPEQTMPKSRADENVSGRQESRDLAMPDEILRGIDYRDGGARPDRKVHAPPTALLGRTFLTVREMIRSAAKNERIAEVVNSASVTESDIRSAVAAEVRKIFQAHARIQADPEATVTDEFDIWNQASEGVFAPIIGENMGHNEIAETIDLGIQNGKTEAQIVEEFVGYTLDNPRLKNEATRRLSKDQRPPRTKAEETKEVKRVEAGLADKLFDMDKTLESQPANVRQFFEEMIAEQQSREDLIAGGYDYTEPGYFDGMTAGALMRELAQAQSAESGIRDPMIAMIQRLRAAGIVGAKYVPGGIKEDGAPPSQSIVIFDERAPVLLTDQAGNLMQERRGQYAPRTDVITLFEQADVTTLMHEAAHWYLETLYSMSIEPDAHPFVVEQYANIKVWYEKHKQSPKMKAARAAYRIVEAGGRFTVYEGSKIKATGLASRDAAEAHIDWIEMHESFAETFEMYLQTGNAPTSSLRSAFQAFKGWITKLWKQYTQRRPTRDNLNPEIVAVIDRMLAVDEEIDAQVEGIIRSAEQQADELLKRGIITKRQRDAAIMNLETARESAKEDLMARLMEAKMREDEAWWATERARVRRDVLREFDKSPVGRALSWLGYGQWKGDVPAGETETVDGGEVEFYQSIRAAARMPMQEINQWVGGKVSANIQDFQNGDESAVMTWSLTDDPDSPSVLMTIRLNRRTGRADTNLMLDNKMADALDNVEDVGERSRLAMEMFAQGVMVMRQYASETPDLKAFSFIAAESMAEGTKRKSREDLYRFLLSSLRVDGYTAYEVQGQTSVVREQDGAKVATPWIPAAGEDPTSGFFLLKDGESIEDFAKSELLRGRPSESGEVVSAQTVKRLTPDVDASGRRVDRRGSRAGAADTGSTLGQSLPRDLIRPASERNIGAAPALPDKAGMIAALDVQVGFAEALLADNQSADLADVTLRLRRTMEQADSLPRNEFLGAWYANLEALARVADSVSPPVAASVRDALASPLGQRVKAVLDDRGVRILQAEQVGEPPVLLIRARMFDGETLGQSTAPTFYSALGRFASRSGTARAPASQWKGMITNAPGIKAEEVEWTGVMEWLDLQEGPVTREALAAFVEGNGVRVEEVVRGQAGATDEIQRRLLPLIEQREQLNRELDLLAPESEDFVILDDRIASLTAQIRELNIEEYESGKAVRFSAHTLPGGENYREMLLTLPAREQSPYVFTGPDGKVISTHPNRDAAFEAMQAHGGGVGYGIAPAREAGPDFRSSHWSEPNVLAHVRFKERTGPNSERVLALEEIQSDWGQTGREQGFIDPQAIAAAIEAGESAAADRALAFEDMKAALLRDDVRELVNAGGTQREKDTIASIAANDFSRNPMSIDLIRNAVSAHMRNPRLSEESRTALQGGYDAYRKATEAFDSAQRARSQSSRGVPNAPFVKNTSSWTELVLKRMIRYAAENGFDAVAWIPGNVQNGRIVDADDNRGDFYDKIVPNIANKLGKKFGARVTQTPMEMPAQARGTGWEDTGQPRAQIDAGAMSWWTLPLTPELAAAAMTEGFPLFQPGDPKGWGETAPPPDLPPMRLDLARTEEIYGKAAVDALPKAIKDRYRDQTSVDSMLAAARGAAKTLKRKPPKSLFQFIRARKSRAVEGKSVPQKQWGIKGATDELKAMDRADLINEASGIHIDYMRELAEEAGYLPEGSTVNDLLNAIDKEARGEPVYSEQDANEVLEIQSAQQWADWLSENGVDIFEADQRKLKAAIAKVTRTTNADLKDPEEAAELLGFENGEQLLRALAEAGSRERFIDAETDRRMREEFGDPFTTGEFAEAARQAAEAEVKFRAAEIEIEALSRALGETAASKLAKEMAMDALSVMTVKELAGWERFLEIERREMRNAMKAVQAGDISKALTHKRRQLVNGHLAKAAREKSEAIEKTRKDLLTYFTSKGRRDKIARDYLDKIEALLETYELRVSKQGPGVQRARLSAKEYVDQMVADGREAEIAPEAMLLAAQADKKVWRGLTVDEVEYLAGTVKNLAHLGRTKNSLMKAQDKRRFDAVVAELVDVLVAAPSTRKRGKSFSPGIVEEQMSRLSVFDAKLTMIPDEFEWLDGKQGGPLATTLGLPFEQADVRKLTMLRDATKKIRGLWNALPSNIRKATLSKRVSTPELALPTDLNMTLMDVVIIGLNWGNAGNRQALIDGYGWDPAAVEAVLDRNLTDAHWQFIEGVWSLIGSYKDEAFALEKRITGVAPKAVEGITFTLPSGRVVKGAYFPLKYDADQESALSVKQGKLDEKQMLSEMGLSFSKPMTKTGHLISRVGSGGKPVKVSLDVFYEHIENVIHDIAFRPAVIDAFRIIRDPRFTQAYIDAAGKAQYDRLMPWLHAIATNNRARFSSTFARTMTFFRGGWSISMMGYSFSTATQQLTGYIEAATEIGPRWVLQGAMKSLSLGPASFWREWAFIRERSEYLANRVAFGKERDIRAVRTNARPGGTLAPIGDNAFVFLSTMDAIVGTGVWRGAYDKAMAGRVDGIAAKDEEQAIAFADRAVQRSLSSGEVYRLPEIMREGEISALMTMVYSYGAKTYNRQRSRNLRARYGQMGLPAYLTSTLIAFMAVPILAALLAGRLWPDDDEDWEERGDDMANEVLMNAAGTTPFVRDMVSLLARPQYGYQLSPVQSTFEQIGVATRSAAEGKTFDSEYQTKQAVMALATVFRLPGGQLFETGDYVYDLYMGAEDPMADPADAAREALIRSER